MYSYMVYMQTEFSEAVRLLIGMLCVDRLGLCVLRVHSLTRSPEFTFKRIYAYWRNLSRFGEVWPEIHEMLTPI